MIEVHDCPDKAKCDGPQAMFPAGFHDLMQTVRQFAEVLKKNRSSSALNY